MVTDYLEGALPPEQHRLVEEHLADCPPCRLYLQQIEADHPRAAHRRAGRSQSGRLAAAAYGLSRTGLTACRLRRDAPTPTVTPFRRFGSDVSRLAGGISRVGPAHDRRTGASGSHRRVGTPSRRRAPRTRSRTGASSPIRPAQGSEPTGGSTAPTATPRPVATCWIVEDSVLASVIGRARGRRTASEL